MPRSSDMSSKRLQDVPKMARLAIVFGDQLDLDSAIIRDLGLRRPIFRQTAAYGHFGRTDIDLPWEATDRVEALRDAAGVGAVA